MECTDVICSIYHLPFYPFFSFRYVRDLTGYDLENMVGQSWLWLMAKKWVAYGSTGQLSILRGLKTHIFEKGNWENNTICILLSLFNEWISNSSKNLCWLINLPTRTICFYRGCCHHLCFLISRCVYHQHHRTLIPSMKILFFPDFLY